MVPNPSTGAFRLFSFKGITVRMHWLWLVAALYFINRGREDYINPVWAACEYLTLFAVVLLHEFGHAFATRQTGGTSSDILLWPFGGVAYVQAPERAGAQLWSIAAGPLVNVALIPVFYGFLQWTMRGDIVDSEADFDLLTFGFALWYMNLGLLIFNMLPVYPLDGGQIVRSLLWYKLGKIRSLYAASLIGLVAGVCLAAVVIYVTRSVYMILLMVFLLSSTWSAFQASRAALRPR